MNMLLAPPHIPPDQWARRHVTYLDRLLKSTILAFASMVPSMPGIIAGAGAAAYDLSRQFWIGGLLSLASMIPFAGYVPGAAKIAWNLRLIDAELRVIEQMLPSLRPWPALVGELQTVVRRYFEKIAKAPGNLGVVSRLRNIMDFQAGEEPAAVASPQAELGLAGE